MQHSRFLMSFRRRSDDRAGRISASIVIASAVLVLVIVTVLVFMKIQASGNEAKEAAPPDSSPAVEFLPGVPKSEEEVSQTNAKTPESLFALDIEIESIKAEAVDVALQLTRDLPGPKSVALLGDVHLNNGNSSEAVECWRKSLELDPNNAVAFNGMAWIAMRKAEYEKAAELWRKVIRIDPNLPRVHATLAGALVCLGQQEKAIESLEKDIELSPRPSHSLVMMGNQYMLLKEYEKAKVAFKTAIKYDPNNPNAHYGLANAYARTGESQISAEYMNTFRELKAKEMEAFKEIDKAFDDLKSVCRKVAEGHIGAGALYMTNGRPAKAEQLFLRAARLDPENTTSRMALASLYLQTARGDEALRLYKELTRVEPDRIKHYVNEGNCAAMLGQPGRAETVFQEIIRLFPTEAAGYKELGRFYLKSGVKSAEAVAMMRNAVSLDGSAVNFYLLSWASDITNDRAGALDAIERALQLEPDNVNYRKIQQRLSQQEK